MDTFSKPSFLFLYLASHLKMKGLPLLCRAKVFLFHWRKHCFSWEWTLIVNTMLLCQRQNDGSYVSPACCFCHVNGCLESQRGSETKEGFWAVVRRHLYHCEEKSLKLHGNINSVLRTGQNSGTLGSSLQGKKPEELWQCSASLGSNVPGCSACL